MKLKVGISSCLMGDEVRFDGEHKKSAFCVDELDRQIQLVRFCSEVDENFIVRVYVFNHWKKMMQCLSKHQLQMFHQHCKLLLLAHDQQRYRELGQRVAGQGPVGKAFAEQYIVDVMDALSQPASRKNQTNVLQHIQGYFKADLAPEQREELSDVILRYHDGTLPLMSPLTLIRHYLREFPKDYLKGQWYLTPYPEDLKLSYGL